jgi:hypothetical protein
MKEVQQEFSWPEGRPAPKEVLTAAGAANASVSLSKLSVLEEPPVPPVGADIVDDTARCSRLEGLAIPKPLSQAVAAGVFGQSTEGPIDPDDDEVAAITEEHAYEMIVLLSDTHAIADSIGTGSDPRTGKIPKTPEAEAKLAEFLQNEGRRLVNAYADAVAAFAEGFGDEAAATLDAWVSKVVADDGPRQDSYDPTHPWHYYHAGDNAMPAPVEEIPTDLDAGQFLEKELPKNPAKRLAKLRAMFITESEQLENDKQRYTDIVERGADALSRYDREIAHSSDALARATALALNYRHVGLGLGRLQWIEDELRRLGVADLFATNDSSRPVE